MLNLIRTDKPELASLEALNAAILEMQEAMKDKVYDLTNPKGRKVATTDRSKLLKIRTGTEKTRNELNRPHIDGKRLIDRIAKNITSAVVEVEGPLVEIIRADDERKAKIKAEKEEKERKKEDERLRKQKEDLDRRQAEIEAQEKPVEVKHDEPEAVTAESKTDEKTSELFDNEQGVVVSDPGSTGEPKEKEPALVNEHADALLKVTYQHDPEYTLRYILSVCSTEDMTTGERIDHVSEVCLAYLALGGES